MSRNRERQQELQPERVEYARTRLEALGYPVTEINATTLQFTFRGYIIPVFRLVYRKNRKGRAGNYEPIKTNTDALGFKTTGKNKSGF